MPSDADWDVVDEASLESFPASDPPGWIRSAAAPSESTIRPEPAQDVSALRRRRATTGLAIGFAALAVLLTAGLLLRRRGII